jgi:GNAT superfamily N-acetyltransferase
MAVIQVVRTYLELLSPKQLRAGNLPPPRGITVARETPCTTDLFRFLYREVGRRYHWVDRLQWTDQQVEEYLSQPNVSLWVMQATKPGSGNSSGVAGYFELVGHDDGAVEIAYFGLLDPFLGRGLGKYLLTVGVQEAWKMGGNRVWLHTCTLDHPAALPNYLARGFREFKQETYTVEIPSGPREPR